MTAIGELKVICSLRPEDPRCSRDLLALLATCPFDDLRDAHQQTVIAAKLMSDETGWFRYCLSLACYWHGDFDQALDIVGKRPGAAQHDAIGQLISSMALARLGDLDSARGRSTRQKTRGRPGHRCCTMGGCLARALSSS